MAALNGMLSTKVDVGGLDRSGEICHVRYHLAPIEADGSNIGTLFAPTTGQQDLIKAGILALTTFNFTRTTASVAVETSAGGLPTDVMAQRESRFRVFYQDAVNLKKYHLDLPCADLDEMALGTDMLDLSSINVQAFVVPAELYIKSELGNAINILGIQYVGKNA